MKRKTALITGICGMDGSILAEQLLEKDYNIIGVMRRNATNNLENAEHLKNKIDVIEGDITDMSSMLRIIQQIKPHEIFNLAAMSHVYTSFEQPLATIDINTKGVVNILECVKSLGFSTRIFHASTSEMFGESPAPQNIETILKPQSPYAIAKVASHHFIRLYREAYKIYCCAGITFNHECLFYNSPVILEKNGMIDICYVGNLVSNKANLNKDISTKDYEKDNIKIWDGKEFVQLKTVSRKKLITLDVKNRKKQITNSPHGIVNTTPNHNLCNLDLEKIPANSVKQGDKLAHGCFPKSFEKNNSLTEDMAKLYGMLCSNRYINTHLKFTNNNADVQLEFARLIKKCFCFTGILKTTRISDFNEFTTQLSVSGISRAECEVLRNKLYDLRTKNKKVPSEVLNASYNIKKTFIEGYYLGCEQKTGNEDYKYKSFKTSSPLLAQGLLYLFQQVYPEQDYCLCTFEQNEKIYTHVNFNSPHKNLGNSFKKEINIVSKIINMNEDNQHVFDIETESGRVCAGIGSMIIGNSERRGPKFVTRKISMGVAKCLQDPNYKLKLGNLDAKRDWGYAPEYCRGFYLVLQKEKPNDYIFATGEMHSVKEFCELAFSHVGLNWEDYVEIDRLNLRPQEVNELCGDYSKTKEQLNWEPKIKFEELVKIMVDYDCKLLGVK